MTCVFLFGFALVYLLRRNNLTRIAAIFILASSTFAGLVEAYGEQFRRPSEQLYDDLIVWLDDEYRKLGRLTVAMPDPQDLAALSYGINFHDLPYEGRVTTLDDLEKIVTHLGIDYLIAPRAVDAWKQRIKDPKFSALFKFHRSTKKFLIYRPTFDAPPSQNVVSPALAPANNGSPAASQSDSETGEPSDGHQEISAEGGP